MNKHDFESDLATLKENVATEVGDVLQALQLKRTAKASLTSKKDVEKQSVPPPSGERALESEPVTMAASPRRQRASSRSRLTPTIEREEYLENVTTRLRQKTNELLTEAALRQRLKKETPSTRQDIIEAALGDWFRKHGYGRSRDEEISD